MSPAFEDLDIKELGRGSNYSFSEMLRRCNDNCRHWDPMNRKTGARVLQVQYKENKEKMSYYHQAKCLSLICVHANGNARVEFDALGVDGDKAGLECISLCKDVKRWEKMNAQSFQPFYDLANDASNAIEMSREKVEAEVEKLQKYYRERDAKLAVQVIIEVEDDDENTEADTEDTEYETDSDEDEVEETVPDKIRLGQAKSLILSRDVPELEFVLEGGDSGGKSIILLMQDHDDTLKCLELLDGYLSEKQKLARRAALEEARKEKKCRAIMAKEDSEEEFESEEELDSEYEDEEVEDDDEELEEVVQPCKTTKRRRDEFEDDLCVDFSKSVTLRFKSQKV